MKSYLSKLGVLLFGAMFAVAACQDYDEDIRQVNTDLSSKIDAAVADLEKKMAKAEDLKDLQDKFNGVQGSIDEAVAALEAAYKAGDKALQDQIDAAFVMAKEAIEAIDAAYKAADEQIKADLALVEGRVSTLESLLDEVSKKADKTAEDLAALAVELRAADTAIRTLIDELTERVAANEGAIKDLQSELATVKTNLENEVAAREALEKKHNLDVEELRGLIKANQEAIAAEKAEREKLSEEFAAYKAENDKKIAALEAADKKLQENIDKVAFDLERTREALKQVIDELHRLYLGLRVDVDKLIARVQSLVYVPEYTDGMATINYAVVKAATETTYIPGKSVLRYKVNSNEEGVAEDIAAAFAADTTGTLLTYDLEGLKVRALEGDATVEVVGVDVDEDGYLAVEVLAKNFLPAFYEATDELGYAAALVLTQPETTNNVASEFTNLTPSKDFDELNLVVKYTIGENEKTAEDGNIDLIAKKDVLNQQSIPSSNVEMVVKTTPSVPYIVVKGDETFYTVETLFDEYGYSLEIENRYHVVSYKPDGNVDVIKNNFIKAPAWSDQVANYTPAKYIVKGATEVGTPKEVSLTAYAEEDDKKYDERVGYYLDVVDSYYFYGQKVGISDRILIDKNLVYINFEAVSYDWTLQNAMDLRDNGVAYAKTITFENVKYNGIYDLSPILNGNVKTIYTHLNGDDDATSIQIRNIKAPTAGESGTANILVHKGYQFAAADAETANNYEKVWRAVLSDTTDAIITVNVTFGKYPEAVVVESDVKLALNTDDNSFSADDALVAAAYEKFTAKNAGFPEGAKVYDLLYAQLADGKTLANENIVLNVVDNADKSYVVLPEQKELKDAYTFTYDVATWFGVPFKFVVNATPVLPGIQLVRSTEYAHATETPGVYQVNLHAKLDETGVYSIGNSDLAFYLNVIGDVHPTQTVKFEVLDSAKVNIKNPVVDVEPLKDPINNPLVGDVTAYLQKQEAVLDWGEYDGTVVKVKATLNAGSYAVDYATLILNVVDPLTFIPSDPEAVARQLSGDTKVKVYENFVLTSSVEEHKNIANLLDVEAASFADILDADIKKAYDITMTLAQITVYEEIPGYAADKCPIYDGSKYHFDPATGIFILKKDDVGELINPIVAAIKVSFKHNIHSGSAGCVEEKTIFVRINPSK